MNNEKRPLKVFLCHASADKPKVRELYRYLKRRGLQPWLDAEDLLPGQNWQVEIPKALETSDAIIICLSKGSVDKEGYVQKEIKFALDKALEMPEGRIFLIPARLEECDVPRSLSGYQWVDLFDEGGYPKLMKSLKVRASQLERAAVQISKQDENSPYLAEKPKQELRDGISVSVNGNVQGNIIIGNENAIQTSAVQPVPEKPVVTKLLVAELKKESEKPPRRLKTEYFVAIIGAAAVILAALIGILPQFFKPAPVTTATPTSIASVTIITPVTTPNVLVVILPTETAQPTPTQASNSSIPENLKGKIVYLDGKDIYSINPTTLENKIILSDATDGSNITLSPDGSNIAFPYKSGIRIYSLVSGSFSDIEIKRADKKVYIKYLAWAPTVEKIAYTFQDEQGIQGIGILDINRRKSSNYFNFKDTGGIAWSSESSKIIFGGSEPLGSIANLAQKFGLYLYFPSSGELKALRYTGPSSTEALSWCIVNDRLLIIGYLFTPNLYYAPKDVNVGNFISWGVGSSTYWSPDCQQIVYVEKGGIYLASINIVDGSLSKIKQIVFGNSALNSPVWVPQN